MPVSKKRAFKPGSSIRATALRRHFVLDKLNATFKTRSGIINNKSELGDKSRKLVPELSSPFSGEQCQG
jgi:hypothetical protein